MYLKIKRLCDLLVSTFLLILLQPVFLVLFIFLYFGNKGHVLFIQSRPGLNEKVFKIIKFCTMTDERGIDGQLLPDEYRITSTGRFIRKYSLDELLQLINVWKGEMSFVGPRPLLVEYLDLYTNNQKKRHCVKPGITGWAQINGRNEISWEKKFELDLWYVENQNFMLDIKILILTVKKVLKSENINKSGIATTTKFSGNN